MFAAVISALPEAVLLVRSGGEIECANSRAADLLGQPAAALAGAPLGAWVFDDERAIAALLRIASRNTSPVPGSLTLRDPKGGQVPCRCEAAALRPRAGGEPALILLRLVPKEAAVNRFVALNLRIEELGREVVRRQRAEAALKEHGEARERERSDADRRKDEFLAMLAHELRNPLAVIGYGIDYLRSAQVRKGAADSAALAELGESMHRHLRQLARLVDDLLDVSRVTTGKITLQKAPVPLGAVLQNAIDVCRPAISAREARLDYAPAREPLVIEADAVRLSQVFSNLISNAVKFSPPGASVRVETGAEGARAVVRVRDAGEGIRPEMLGAIFDMFTQADNSLARPHGGLGVGLTIAKVITELHGGGIEAHSEGPGRGSEFVVSLPLVDRPSQARQDAAGPAGASAASRRILVVDDNVDAATSLAILLRALGHQVQVASSGARALEQTRTLHPEVVLLDLGMPDMDGFAVARRLRESGGDFMIIAVTGYGAEADRRKTKEAGFDHHLTKPIDADALQKLMGVR